MKRFLSTLLVFFICFFYLFIKVSYNGSEPISLYFLMLQDLNISNLDLKNYPNNFSIIQIEIILCVIFLLSSIFIKKNIYTIIISCLMLIVWGKNYYLFRGIIDNSIYIKSSIPFLLLLI
ncbi:hypothetical protein, partial [Empedobacter brevis]|uniref:hypothetical protein n=1 Tax=Empedobacter brevis TaxID=247 RepID=UPI00333F5A15